MSSILDQTARESWALPYIIPLIFLDVSSCSATDDRKDTENETQPTPPSRSNADLITY